MRKKIYIVIIVIILPFWDMIINEPIYKLLRSTVPEIERYKPYKKVEGFYEDFIPSGNIAFNMFLHNTFEKKYSIYFDKQGEYYKAFWLNNSKSPTCFPPQPSTVEEEYIEYINKNWCISVIQIDKSEMTKYWKLTKKEVFHFPILYLNIYVVDFFVSDRNTGDPFFRLRDVYVDKSWLTALNLKDGKKGIRSGTKYTYSTKDRNFNFPDYKIIKLLDSKSLPKI